MQTMKQMRFDEHGVISWDGTDAATEQSASEDGWHAQEGECRRCGKTLDADDLEWSLTLCSYCLYVQEKMQRE
jgi:hypothetical protein